MAVAEPAASPQGQVMQMMTAAWLARTISAVTRLAVPDLVRQHGPLSARELTERHGVQARLELLERALPGRERTEAEWRTLYAQAGLRLVSSAPINPRSAECIVEGVKA